jgi:hypothetical protein
MGSEKAAAVFTDPPYNLAVGHVSGRGQIQHREFVIVAVNVASAKRGGDIVLWLSFLYHQEKTWIA